MIPATILVLCTRRLGDVLLATALVRSLRLAWPAAAIDVLTLASSSAALEGNPDVRRVLSLPAGAGAWTSLAAIGGWRRYDLAISTVIDDRPHLLAFCAAPWRVNIVPSAGMPQERWKKWLSPQHAETNVGRFHTVTQNLRLADVLGVARHASVVPPRPANTARLEQLLGAQWSEGAYAVVHPAPLYTYKSWTVQGWADLLVGLIGRGLRVVLTAGPADQEQAFVRAVLERCPAGNIASVAGQLKLAELTPLIENARVYVGPDTSVTHLAAATGRPTIALFGPSNPVNWGPWPQGYAAAVDSPWTLRAPMQHQGNVWVVQGIKHCVPCLGEGCDKHLNSRAACLDEMPAARVLAVVDQALAKH